MSRWWSGYQVGWLRADVIAGLTVTAILVPEGMAYAQLAGVPPQAAFYAAPAALLLYAVLGSSRQLVVAVSSAIAITSAAVIIELAPEGTAEYVTLTAALALLAGLISMAAGFLRLGRVARFFSPSVLLGFVFGLALIISLKQVPKILGVEIEAEEFFPALWETIRAVPQTHLPTLVVGVGCVVAMVALERFMPKLPAALAVLVGSLAASVLLDLAGRGVAVVGPLPAGLAAPQLPGAGWDAVALLTAGAMGIALLAFAEAIGPAQRLAKEHGYEVDPDRELIAVGAANAGAGLFQGFSIGASLSKSAANDRAGARTPMSLVVAAAATALVAVFLTPLFQDLPEAALGAIVIVAVSEMERIAPLRRLWDLRRSDFVLALVALLGVLTIDILPGLLLAVVASLAVIVWRASQARIQLVGQRVSGSAGPATQDAPPGLLVVRPQEQLFFANAAEIRDEVLGALAGDGPRPDVVLVDLALTADLDVPALDVLAELRERLTAMGCQMWVATTQGVVRGRLVAAGVVDDDASTLFAAASGAAFAYLSLHTVGGGAEAHRAALSELLDIIDARTAEPGLDERGRASLDVIAGRIREELDGGEGPDAPATPDGV
ncbi:MAG TPA: SulP family inorganic anion transporter [Actinotalea sp.]|nr:SulP family inorganic anion transporter [Actinotalea sp.]